MFISLGIASWRACHLRATYLICIDVAIVGHNGAEILVNVACGSSQPEFEARDGSLQSFCSKKIVEQGVLRATCEDAHLYLP